jgi:mRNA-degrading endonuclease toxin of MazEF toxin-antitoxin module
MTSLVKPLDVLDQGEILWGEPTDTKGSEQEGDRLWIVMSRRKLNGSNTVVAVPFTRKIHKAAQYPHFCILIPPSEAIPIPGPTPSLERVA